MNININKETLNFVFKRLRMKEGIKDGKITSSIDSETIFKILVNIRFKQEKGLLLTELEKNVYKEVGQYIKAYVWQKWEEEKKQYNYINIPFIDIERKTLKEFIKNAS